MCVCKGHRGKKIKGSCFKKETKVQNEIGDDGGKQKCDALAARLKMENGRHESHRIQVKNEDTQTHTHKIKTK